MNRLTSSNQISGALTKAAGFVVLLIALQSTLHADNIHVEGKAFIGGEHLDFAMTLSETEMFINQVTGYQTMTSGYDGQALWRVENGTGPFNIDFSEREIWVIAHWMLSGYWLDKNAPITWSTDPATGNAILRLNNGRLKLSVPSTLEELKSGLSSTPSRALPAELKVINLPQELTLGFSGQQTLAGRILPRRVSINGIGEVEYFDIESAKILDEQPKFEKPMPQLNNVSFDSTVAAEIEIKQADSGHIFVKPQINGETVGWFLFDSGAGGTQLSEALIDKFALQRVAETITGGIGGSTGYSNVFTGAELKLGPLTIDNLNFKAFDPKRSLASRVLGSPVHGVLGWDILTRSIVEVDMKDARMWIHNPGQYRIPAENSERLYLHWKVPYVLARFSPDHEGIFMLDTGAGNHGIFFPHFSVKTFNLLAGQKGKRSDAHGAGGRISIVRGSMDWFEVAGHKTENAPAVFSVGEDHEADIFSTGFLGGAVITPFKVVFDYRRNEVGFIPR